MFGANKKLHILLAITFMVLAGFFSLMATAAVVQFNTSGGTTADNGLRVYIDDTTQIQVRRRNEDGTISGQMYHPDYVPSSSLVATGIYLRANNVVYGPSHNFITTTAYTGRSVSAVTTTTTPSGLTYSATSTFGVTNGPQMTVVWKYIFPYQYVTAEVTVKIPSGYSVSSNNPVRYYHAVDTYLGGDDFGCGVRYTDVYGKKVVGTYPTISGGCPNSTQLPAGLDVVETFRERTGTFSHYCVATYSTIWGNGTCGIRSSSALNDTVNTSRVDTGVAVEYDFTASGTYTFSYDFVVGSTKIANYDHVEIRHAGIASSCQTDVQVLACTSSVVPCPDANIVNSGFLQGSLTVSPATPAVTTNPDDRGFGFTVGTGTPIDTVPLQGSGVGTYTLGITGLSTLPNNGVKCWNNATNSQSCSLTMPACLDSFECMESGVTYTASARHPIYTKLTSKAFNLDVYALLPDSTQATGYVSATNGVRVELVSDTGNACGSTVVATKQVSFTSTNAGKQTVSFTSTDVPNAYPSLRCRVTDTTLGKVGCSSDNFSVRPQAFTISSSNATGTSPTSTPVFRASTDTFNLKAITGESNYTGTPLVGSLTAHSGAPAVGVISYVNAITQTITGSLPAAVAGISTANNFKYSEVGLFQFAANSVYDETFTAVDQASGDCNSASPFNNDANAGKYGCKIGNVASSYFGRFIPDKFEITINSVTKACDTFAYYDQDTTTNAALNTQFTITAQNGLGATTQNYVGNYAKFDPATWGNFNFTTSPALTNVQLKRSKANNSLTGSWVNGVAAMTAKFYVPRPSTGPIDEQIVTVRTQVQDSDGVTTTTSPFPIASTVPFRYGRLAIPPVHGSELLPLTVPIEAQYWNATGYKRSTEDGCTTFNISTIAMRNYRGNLNACETVLSGSTTMVKGKMDLRLSAPGVTGSTPNTGSVDLALHFGSAGGDQTCISSVQSNATDGTAGMSAWFGADPVGRATFGIYKAPIIYMRENF